MTSTLTGVDHLPYHWIPRLLHLLVAPAPHESFRFLNVWARCEGGSATYNPLNTTFPVGFGHSYNDVGVKNYSTPVEGISGTACTFAHEPYLLALWKDLQNGTFTAEELLSRNTDAIGRWGTDTVLFARVLAETP